MQKELQRFPLLLTREQASSYLGIDPKSFDKFIRSHSDMPRFMVGSRERFTIKDLDEFVFFLIQ